MGSHSFWGNRILTAIKYGHLEKEDYKLSFEQYYSYSKNFTRHGIEAIALRLNIEFTVTRPPFDTEVIDARFVKIPSGKFNEKHRHAHETVHSILSGKGKVVLDKDPVINVFEGDSVTAQLE